MNAKKELTEILYGEPNVKCASLYIKNGCNEVTAIALLSIGYNDKQWNTFTKKLDFDYNNSTGNQNLYGNVWLNDGSWLKRKWTCDAFKCREHWKYIKQPEIPNILNKK